MYDTVCRPASLSWPKRFCKLIFRTQPKKMTRSEFFSDFKPSIRMAALSALWFGLSKADNIEDDEGYSLDKFISRLLNGPNALSVWDKLAYFALLAAALEVFNYIAVNLGGWIKSKPLPSRGKHLDEFTQKDNAFLLWNKIANGPFVLVAFMYINWDPNYLWKPEDMTLKNVFLPVPLFFIVYDFFYTLGHLFLHQKGIYPLIHKHHHRQQVPSRGHVDALNVHPVEYFFGQYLAIWTMFLICRFTKMHAVGGNLIMVATNAASCFNHQRFDIKIPLFGTKINLYESKAHDLHHLIPSVNFGQYIQLWDWVFGTHRPYFLHEKGPVDPTKQLDHKTGETRAEVKALREKAS